MNTENSASKISFRTWTAFVIYGLIGQIAWTIENNYLNVFIYKTVTYNPDAIAVMVAASAVIATLATLFMGALSDKLGKRKVFMAAGYIIWGITITLFGVIKKQSVAKLFPAADAVTLTVTFIVMLDCLMTYIGSTANDAAFNAWVTDVTVPSNRGRAEGLLATMPLLSMLVVFGLLDGLTQKGKWIEFFLIVGAAVFASGILGIFIIKDKPMEKKEGNYFQNIFYGFRISTIKQNKLLYIIFATVCLLGIAQQVFMPYFIIYFEFYLHITDYALVLGVVLIFASIISVLMGRLVDKFGKQKFLIPSAIVYVLGMLALYIVGIAVKGNKILIMALMALFGTLTMGAYMLEMVALNSATRDLIPKDHVGLFVGIRMIFFVMIPMVIGPLIGSNIIKNSPLTYIDEFGTLQSTPTPGIFLGGAIVAVFSIIPVIFILRDMKKPGYYASKVAERN